MNWYFTLYASIRFLIEGLRQDSLMLGSFRISQVISLMILILSVSFMLLLKKNKNKV